MTIISRAWIALFALASSVCAAETIPWKAALRTYPGLDSVPITRGYLAFVQERNAGHRAPLRRRLHSCHAAGPRANRLMPSHGTPEPYEPSKDLPC